MKREIGPIRAVVLSASYQILGIFILAFSEAGLQPWAGMVAFLGLTWAFQIRVNRRPWHELGLPFRPQAVEEWGAGAASGLALLSAVLGMIAICGSARIAAPAGGSNLTEPVIPLAVYAFVEEMIFRGYSLATLARALGSLNALLFTSWMFALSHAANPSADAAGILSAFLGGLIMGAIVLRWRSLWAAWGFHFAWNYAQGALYGLPISGVTSLASQPLRVTRLVGPAWLTGGSYGAEASLPALLVLSAIAWLLIFWKRWPSLAAIQAERERRIREELEANYDF